MTLSETVGEGIIYVAISGGSFHSLPGLIMDNVIIPRTRKRILALASIAPVLSFE